LSNTELKPTRSASESKQGSNITKQIRILDGALDVKISYRESRPSKRREK